MKRVLSIITFIFVWQMVAFAQPSIKIQVDQLLKDSLLKTSEVGISVYDLTENRYLYRNQSKKLFRPASIQKLVTAITGLSVLGEQHRLSTNIYRSGTLKNGILEGNLYVVGGFDSEFIYSSMEGMAQMLYQSGIREVKGKLIADVSMMDSLYWGAGWSWDDAPYSFQPMISPLMVQKGTVEITAQPTNIGEPAQLICTPSSSYYTIVNQTKSVSSGETKLTLSRDWMNNDNKIIVTGNISTLQRAKITISHSSDYFMHTFIQRAADRGITLPNYTYGELPTDSSQVQFVGRLSHPLRLVLQRAMKNSDNLSAEAILYQTAQKELAKKHLSREDGVKVIKRVITELGLDPEKYNLVDGCGVSLYNYLSPELLLTYLKYAYSQKSIFDELYPALPISGVDGTLSGRMKEGKAYKKIHAKTGSVTGVSSLAGYATAANGHLLAFVIINQNVLQSSKARAWQDKFCEVLCGYGEENTNQSITSH